MSSSTPLIDKSIIKALYPLSLVADHLLDKLIAKTQLELPKSGQPILKRSTSNIGQYHYLIEGEVEHRISFDDRRVISSADVVSNNPLQELLEEGGAIKAVEDCCILVVDVGVVEEFLSWSQSQEFKVVHMDDNDDSADDDAVIDDDFQEDWSDLFLKSQLAANIPAATMLEMFTCLEDVDVNEGSIIVQENSPGDYFYIIKKGDVDVITNSHGPFKGEVFTLTTGDYFGDEALVADTTRNATVKMATDGVLGRLSREEFDNIIKAPLMQYLSQDDLKALPTSDICYLDVRLAAEYRHGHYPDAKNYPIAYIRKHLHSFESALTYVITPECARRGELAVYLLKQAGYQVYLMQA